MFFNWASSSLKVVTRAVTSAVLDLLAFCSTNVSTTSLQCEDILSALSLVVLPVVIRRNLRIVQMSARQNVHADFQSRTPSWSSAPFIGRPLPTQLTANLPFVISI